MLVVYEDTEGRVIQTQVTLYTSYQVTVGTVDIGNGNVIVVDVLDQDLNQVRGLSLDEPDSFDEDRLLLISQLKD